MKFSINKFYILRILKRKNFKLGIKSDNSCKLLIFNFWYLGFPNAISRKHSPMNLKK